MTASELSGIFKANGGIVTSSLARKNNINAASLSYWTKKGFLEKAERGVYVLADSIEDEFVKFQAIYKKGIYSLQSALFLLSLTDRTPFSFTMTFPSHYNVTSPKRNGIVCNQVKEELFEIGKISVKTPFGNNVFCYNAERTLCDITKTTNQVDTETLTTAFKMYAQQKTKNLHLLSEYSKLFHVEKKIRSYMEVLL